MTNLLVIAIASLIWFFMGVLAARRVNAAVATVTSTYNGLMFVQTAKAFGFNNTVNAYLTVAMMYVKNALVPVTDRVRAAVATVTSTVRTVATIVTSYVRTVATVTAARVQHIADSAVEMLSAELPDTSTSTYALSSGPIDSRYCAGEYLIRDNGAWRNVTLTAHARALIGESADIIALSVATVHDASGTSRVWHVAIA